jgi:hypothetical protein
MSYDPNNSSDEELSEEEAKRQREIGNKVAEELGDDPNMSDEEWDRRYNEGKNY